MSDNHKIDRQKLLGWSRQKPNPLGEFGGGDIVIRLFQRLFPGAGVLDDESSFRDLGGYSLLLMDGVTWLRNEGIRTPPAPATLMKLDTVGAIRKALARQESVCEPVEPVAMTFSTLSSLRRSAAESLPAAENFGFDRDVVFGEGRGSLSRKPYPHAHPVVPREGSSEGRTPKLAWRHLSR